MKSKRNKTIAIFVIAIVILSIFSGIVYSFFLRKNNKENELTIGSLNIEIINLNIQNKENELVHVMEPGDISYINWTANNIGTATCLTRHTMYVYLGFASDLADTNILYLYPANMSNEEIIADFQTDKSKMITTEATSKQVDNKTIYGVKYQFLGETLKGTDDSDISQITSQDISFKLLLSPKTSYLLQDKPISVDIVTEAVQYTENGARDWQVVDSENL